MNIENLKIDPKWRTQTVVDLCLAMRETQDFSAMPILADALQEADCGDETLLQFLRNPTGTYAIKAGVVGLVTSQDTEEAVLELHDFGSNGYDCPDYEILVNAASGHHKENKITGDEYGWIHSKNDGEYLCFGGVDAHGDIPDRFWDLVQKATGKVIHRNDRAKYFSCSC